MTLILSLAVAMLAGLMMSRPAKLVGFPAVTAYLIAGILIGPYCLGLLGVPGLGFGTAEQVDAVSIVSDIALGFIAFAIGNEFRLSTLRENGKTATVIGIIQAVVTSAVVDIALVVTHFIIPDTLTLPAAITLGAVAAATARAATLMVVRQYKAHGHMTDLLLPIVALDDAVGLVIFAVSYGVAHALQNGDIDIITIVVNPIAEIIASLLLGSAMGAVLTFIERFFHSIGMPINILELIGRQATDKEIQTLVEKCSRGGKMNIGAMEVLTPKDMTAIYRLANERVKGKKVKR